MSDHDHHAHHHPAPVESHDHSAHQHHDHGEHGDDVLSNVTTMIAQVATDLINTTIETFTRAPEHVHDHHNHDHSSHIAEQGMYQVCK